MRYTEIDLEHWARKEYFLHYWKDVPCTYSMTVKLDITSLRQKGLKLYPSMLYCLTRAVNRWEPFRTACRPDGKLVVYDSMSPCYTVFHKDSETFSNLWTEFAEDYGEFCRRYAEDAARFGSVHAMTAKPDVPENSFTVSMLPWTSFEGFHLNVNDYRYLLPIFTIGQYQDAGERRSIPLAVQVHHAVCDGYHVSRFLRDLQEILDACPGSA